MSAIDGRALVLLILIVLAGYFWRRAWLGRQEHDLYLVGDEEGEYVFCQRCWRCWPEDVRPISECKGRSVR